MTCMLKSYSGAVGSSLRRAKISGATGMSGCASVCPNNSFGRVPFTRAATAPLGSMYLCSYINTTAPPSRQDRLHIAWRVSSLLITSQGHGTRLWASAGGKYAKSSSLRVRCSAPAVTSTVPCITIANLAHWSQP